MRLLLATDHYPPFIGGAHRQAQLLARGMAERGHDVTVVTSWHGGLPPVENQDGIEVHRVKQMRTAVHVLSRGGVQRHQPPFPDPVTIHALRRIIRKAEPDLVHAYGWLAFSVAAALGRRRIPMLVSARDYGYFCATRTLLRHGQPCSGPALVKCALCAGSYYRGPKGWVAATMVAMCRPWLVRKITGLHSVSAYVQEVTRSHLFEGGNMPPNLIEATIPSFQDVAPSDPAGEDHPEVAARLAKLPDEPFILFVGAFRKVKGLQTLFDAYGRLESPPPLVLIGTYERDSPEWFPPEAVVITDAPHTAVMAAWDRAMFGVMPSLWPEPLGATVAEAMSRGKPVIGTRPGGHADMIGDDAGILVPQGNVEAFAKAMRELIDDPARRDAYGRAAKERARAFTAATVLPRFEQLYREVIAADSRDPSAAGAFAE